MPTLFLRKTLPYPARLLLSIITDVEKYPEFIRFCCAAEITSMLDQQHFKARLHVKYLAFKDSYESTIKVCSQEDGKHLVQISAVHGSLEHMQAEWVITEQKSSCDVQFSMDYSLRASFFAPFLSQLVKFASSGIIADFEARAATLYAAKSF